MRIAIIGGGAAGMMAAATLAESLRDSNNHRVTLFEKNKSLGAKVIISGGGRCNVTTGITDRKILLTKYPRGAKRLVPALNKFAPGMVVEWFEDHGVPLHCEQDLRVFPDSNNGADVVGVFEKIFRKTGVTLALWVSVKTIEQVGETFVINGGINGETYDKIVVATGGNAYAHTGSTGDGYSRARGLGHTITPLGPSLSSFLTRETRPHAISGLSFADARVQWGVATVRGPILFTHFGISGPVTFSASAVLAREKIAPESPVTIKVAPYADKKTEWREETLITLVQESPKKMLKNLLHNFFAERFIEQLLGLVEVPLDLMASSLTKVQRRGIASLLGDGIPLTLVQRRAGDEFVTAGWVDTDQINPKTMESLVCPGSYRVGEVLNIDGVTGGFNLQASWATGRAAWVAILELPPATSH